MDICHPLLMFVCINGRRSMIESVYYCVKHSNGENGVQNGLSF